MKECKARENDAICPGRTSVVWYKAGEPQIYCYGYTNKMTDELLPECRKCNRHVGKAQEDMYAYMKASRKTEAM